MLPAYLKNLNDQERHTYILERFILNKTAAAASKYKRDIDVIKEHHKFLWEDGDESTWETQLAKRYYDKLFREYCIADLSRHKENRLALRWRTEAEVVTGKGQFQCGSRQCEVRAELRTWEVNFAYQEHGGQKNALVKVRLCMEHSAQLNYTSRKREVKRMKHMDRKEAKNKKKRHRIGNCSPQSSANINNEESEPNDSCHSITEATSGESEAVKVNDTDKDVAGVSIEVEDAWSKRPEIELEPTSRETEFERYLEDLLL